MALPGPVNTATAKRPNVDYPVFPFLQGGSDTHSEARSSSGQSKECDEVIRRLSMIFENQEPDQQQNQSSSLQGNQNCSSEELLRKLGLAVANNQQQNASPTHHLQQTPPQKDSMSLQRVYDILQQVSQTTNLDVSTVAQTLFAQNQQQYSSPQQMDPKKRMSSLTDSFNMSPSPPSGGMSYHNQGNNNLSASDDSDHSGQYHNSGQVGEPMTLQDLLHGLSLRNQRQSQQHQAAMTSPVGSPGSPGIIGSPSGSRVNNTSTPKTGGGLGHQQDTSPLSLSLAAQLSARYSNQEENFSVHSNTYSNSVLAPLLQLQQQQLDHDFHHVGSPKRGGAGGGGGSCGPGWANSSDAGYYSYSVERAAHVYRHAASSSEPTYTWCGALPTRVYKNPIYSNKVFLGGVPWDITEAGLMQTFKFYGAARVEWPGKDSRHPRYPGRGKIPGYVYLLFDSEKSVRMLLQNCTHDFSHGGDYYYKISSRRIRCKEVQVIPWVICDSNYVSNSSQRLDASKTVFVGALHGMMTAEALGKIMEDLFGAVVYAGIDTDKYKYPIGSGRVTFSNARSYMKAVNAAFVEVKTTKFVKKIQIDPYLEDATCSQCMQVTGPYFCRELMCFKYYCRSCWYWQHSIEALKHHKPLMKNTRGGGRGTTNGGGSRAASGSPAIIGSPLHLTDHLGGVSASPPATVNMDWPLSPTMDHRLSSTPPNDHETGVGGIRYFPA